MKGVLFGFVENSACIRFGENSVGIRGYLMGKGDGFGQTRMSGHPRFIVFSVTDCSSLNFILIQSIL